MSSIINVTKIKDLTYYDGPLLSLFQDNSHNKYLMYWCDVNDTYNKWLLFHVSDLDYYLYMNKMLTLRFLILESKEVFTVDIDDNITWHNITRVNSVDIPLIYLPSNKSYYEGINND